MGRKFKIDKHFKEKVKDITRGMNFRGLNEKFILDVRQLINNKGDLRLGIPLIWKTNNKHLTINAQELLPGLCLRSKRNKKTLGN